MKIASWNVNSIKARLEHVKKFLTEARPDVLMIQELKGLDFPQEEVKSLGYTSVFKNQKAYNGIAVLAKNPIALITDELPGDNTDEQARYMECEVNDMRLINIYLPNGNPYPSEKFDYKLKWMNRLYARLKHLREESVPFAIGGDFNVIPENKDCFNPGAWANDALFRPESKQKFRALLNLGLTDAFRVFNQTPGQYTFWDYQAGAWPRNNGIRIDHFLLSPELADRLKTCTIDKTPRGWDSPSDHTPIIVELQS